MVEATDQAAPEQVAMVLVAHPDDAEFGCAGTAALWASEGWAVYYVIVTDASGGGPDDADDSTIATRQQTTATRQAEQRQAGAVAGVRDVLFLNYPDGQVTPSFDVKPAALREHQSQIAERFDSLAPQLREGLARNGESYSYAYAELFHRTENP